MTLAAVSGAVPWLAQALRQEGIEVLETQRLMTLPPPLADHADLQLLHLGGNRVLLAQEAAGLESLLTKNGFVVLILVGELGNRYPQDVSLNFLLLQNACFGLCSNMPLQIKKHCIDAGLQSINVKQGYARCSVAVVSDGAAITADWTLYQRMTACGFDVLLVEPGDILLDGYDTGLLGGCCGLLDKDKLAFTGNLEQYQSGREILDFLERHQVQPVYLRNGKLLDVGGILPLMER